jgi:hypothetical protein
VTITIPVGPGELLDKVTILEIKAAELASGAKLAHVRAELDALEPARAAAVAGAPGVRELAAELKEVNRALWRIEDDIRGCERARDFGARFVELARSVYRTNDRRAALKRRINELLDATIVEEKSYAQY